MSMIKGSDPNAQKCQRHVKELENIVIARGSIMGGDKEVCDQHSKAKDMGTNSIQKMVQVKKMTIIYSVTLYMIQTNKH